MMAALAADHMVSQPTADGGGLKVDFFDELDVVAEHMASPEGGFDDA
jgi:hypothetical protein